MRVSASVRCCESFFFHFANINAVHRYIRLCSPRVSFSNIFVCGTPAVVFQVQATTETSKTACIEFSRLMDWSPLLLPCAAAMPYGCPFGGGKKELAQELSARTTDIRSALVHNAAQTHTYFAVQRLSAKQGSARKNC